GEGSNQARRRPATSVFLLAVAFAAALAPALRAMRIDRGQADWNVATTSPLAFPYGWPYLACRISSHDASRQRLSLDIRHSQRGSSSGIRPDSSMRSRCGL